MRNASANRRSRGRNSNRGNKGGNNRTRVYDSNGPEVRIRGTAHQICEKYEALAKDAASAGDAVLAESYLQYAEHYQRIISEINEQQAARQENNSNSNNGKAYNKDENKKVDGNTKTTSNDDLSLPSSILGDGVEVKSRPVRALEDA